MGIQWKGRLRQLTELRESFLEEVATALGFYIKEL